MSISPNFIIVVAGLLTAPALAEVVGLRGSVRDGPAADEDRASARELRPEGIVELNSTSYDPPTFPPIPQISPDQPIEFPPGITLAKRESSVMTVKTTEAHFATETITAHIITDENSTEAGSQSVLTVDKDVKDEMSLQEIELEVDSPEEYDVYHLDVKNLRTHNETNSEVIATRFNGTLSEGNITAGEGYYYSNVMSETLNASEISVSETIHDPIAERTEQYFDGARTSGQWLGGEKTLHQYAFKFADSEDP